MEVKNKIALVTGANRGIGKAITIQLLEEGALKVYAGARNPSTLMELQEKYGERIVPVKLDVTNADDIEKTAQIAHDTEILINNAGITVFGTLLGERAEEKLQQNLAVNVFGVLNLTKAFINNLKNKPQAAIVNVGSIAGLGNMPVIGAYAATKAAAHSITQGFRGELKNTNVFVVGVYPGPIETEMSKDFDAPKDTPENVAKAIIEGLRQRKEDVFPDFTSVEVEKTYTESPKSIEKQFALYI